MAEQRCQEKIDEIALHHLDEGAEYKERLELRIIEEKEKMRNERAPKLTEEQRKIRKHNSQKAFRYRAMVARAAKDENYRQKMKSQIEDAEEKEKMLHIRPKLTEEQKKIRAIIHNKNHYDRHRQARAAKDEKYRKQSERRMRELEDGGYAIRLSTPRNFLSKLTKEEQKARTSIRVSDYYQKRKAAIREVNRKKAEEKKKAEENKKAGELKPEVNCRRRRGRPKRKEETFKMRMEPTRPHGPAAPSESPTSILSPVVACQDGSNQIPRMNLDFVLNKE